MKPINRLWAENLAHQLKTHHMTRQLFATLMGVSEGCVYKWLAGGTVSLDSLAKAALVLKVHPARLLGSSAVSKRGLDAWYEGIHRAKLKRKAA